MGDKGALVELSFTNDTTKTWEHSRRVSFFRKSSGFVLIPPWSDHIFIIHKIQWETHFYTLGR